MPLCQREYALRPPHQPHDQQLQDETISLVESAQYTSEAYNSLCDKLGVVQSMGKVGSALDNAAAESFNSLIKVEYIHRHHFATRAEARLKIATWITHFYNPRRRHSGAAGLPPVEFERIVREARASRHQDGQTA